MGSKFSFVNHNSAAPVCYKNVTFRKNGILFQIFIKHEQETFQIVSLSFYLLKNLISVYILDIRKAVNFSIL